MENKSENNLTEFGVPPLEDVEQILEKIKIDSEKKDKQNLQSEKNDTKLNKEEKNETKTIKKEKMFAGMKKGFLTETKKPKKINKLKEEIPFIKSNPENNSLKIKNVQNVLKNDPPIAQVQSDFPSNATSHPKVLKVLSDPAWVDILHEFQTDPEAAARKYERNEEVKQTMLDLCSILGDSFLHMKPSQKSVDEVSCQRLMEDPKLREALTDPSIEALMDYMKKGQNDRVQRIIAEAPSPLKAKIQMLIDYGLLSFAS